MGPQTTRCRQSTSQPAAIDYDNTSGMLRAKSGGCSLAFVYVDLNRRGVLALRISPPSDEGPAYRTLLRTRRGVTSLKPFRTIVLVTSTYFSNRDGRTWRSLASSRVAAHDSTNGLHPMSFKIKEGDGFLMQQIKGRKRVGAYIDRWCTCSIQRFSKQQVSKAYIFILHPG